MSHVDHSEEVEMLLAKYATDPDATVIEALDERLPDDATVACAGCGRELLVDRLVETDCPHY